MASATRVSGLVWATRGRSWGFRFLLDGGVSRPLAVYEPIFAQLEGESSGLVRSGSMVALRFTDPEGRRDTAGRRIPHDFVVGAPLGDQIHSVEDGVRLVWPVVCDAYASIWDREQAPSREEVLRLSGADPTSS